MSSCNSVPDKVTLPIFSAHMICYSCQHRFDVDDYNQYRQNDDKCPNCGGEHIFDESSDGWKYVKLQSTMQKK